MKRHLYKLPHLFFKSGLVFLFLILVTVKSWAQPCSTPPANVNPCQAPVICSGALVNTYCSTTTATAPIVSPGPFCGAPNNNQFIAFVAGATSVSIQINVDLASCATTPDGTGLQAEIYSTTNCANGSAYTSVSNCFSANADAGELLVATGLTIGQTYYLMVDGWSGDICNYSLDLVSATSSIGFIPTAPVPTGPTALCPGVSGTYSVNPVNGITYNWTVSGGGASISGPSTGNSVSVNFPSSVNPYTVNVCVTASNPCGASAPSCKTVNIIPVVPINPPPFTICSGDAVIYHGTNYTNSAGTADDGTFNYVHNLTSYLGCDSIVTITVNKLPAITASQTVLLCEGETITVCGQTYSLGPAQCSATQVKVCTDAASSGCDSTITLSLTKVAVNAVITPANPTLPCSNPTVTLNGAYSQIPGCFGTITYQWTNSAGTILGTGPTLNVTTPGTYNLLVTNTVNLPPPFNVSKTCSKTTSVVVTTSGGTPATPVVTGNATPCQGASATYSVVADPTATTYAWTVPAGATITAGTNTNSITVLFGNTSGSVCCAITNSCGTSAPGCLPVTLGMPPTQPTITGPATLCTNTGTYSITAQTGATYAWTITGGSITSGQGTTSVNVNWGASASGTVAVTVTNTCGNAMNSLPVTIGGAPPAPGAITGNTAICVGSSITYSIAAVAGATSYTWTAPTNGTITGGQGTASVTINYPGPAAPSGQVCVTATNACGTGLPTCITITAGATPAQPGAITGPTAPCTNATGTMYSIAAVAGATTYNWTVPAGATITAGQGTTNVTVNWGTTSGQVCVTAANPCGTSTAQCLTITLGTAPAQPGVITGPASLCVGAMGTYSIANVAGATTYTWVVPAGVTIGSGQGTNTIMVTANTAPGGNITVTAGNACGNSTASTLGLAVNALPNSNAGANINVCGTMATLAAVPSVGTGTWTHTGPGGSLVTYGNANAANSTVTVNMTGAYTFTWTENNNGCTDNDQVLVNFNSTPQAGPATETCNGANNAITVSFNITGGTAPYTVVNCGTGTNAGAVAAGVFTSTSIASPPGVYCFVLNDANSCGPDTVSGVKICACTTTSATMGTAALPVCEGQQATATTTGSPVLDANDVVAYVLHTNSGSSLGTVIATSATPVFGFQAPMVYGTTYYISQIVGDNNGSGQVALNDPCLSVASGQPVTFYQLPNAQAGADNETCGTTITLDGTPSTGFGQWTQTSGLGTASFDNASFSDPNVTVDQLGVYTFTWTENNNGCTDADQVTISFNSAPALSGVVNEICNGAATAYTVSFAITGGESPYTVLNSVNMSPTGTTTGSNFTSGSFTSGSSYSFIIEDNNGCQSAVISGTVTCNCATNAGTIDLTAQQVCTISSTVAPVLNGDQTPDPDDIGNWVLHDNPGTSLGNILGQNQTGVFSFNAGTMTLGTNYYLSYVLGNDAGGNMVDLSDACTDVSQGQQVVFVQEPTANAGPDQGICGLQTTLAAVPGVGTGTWTLASGPGTANFANANDPVSNVTVSQNGTYTFTWTVDNNGCTDQQDVQVAFNGAPAVTGILELCNATNTAYTVSFTINGGASPYTVNASSILGNTFTSASLPSGSAYTFTVTDANNCSTTITGSKTCDCTTQIGTMTDINTVFGFCTDEQACVVYDNAGETLDADDVIEFILSTETPFINIVATSSTPCFNYTGSLLLDVTYYITAIVGNNDGTGHVDLIDPCLDVSQASKVVFHQTITAAIASDQTICSGECATLTLSLQGNPPFDVTYSDGTSNFVLNGATDGETISVCPTTTTTYTVLSVSNADGCSANITTPAAQVTVVPATGATIVAADEVCNTNASGFPTSRDFNLYILSGNTNGTWTDTDNSGAAGTFPVLDFNGVTPGVYTFTYALPPSPPCTNQSYTIEITVTNNCQCPDVTTLPPSGGLCNDNNSLDLTSLTLPTTAAGSWSIVATPTGFSPAFIFGNTFVATDGDPGVYLLQYNLLTPPPGTCATSSQQSVTVEQAVNAGTASPPNELCQGQASVIDLALLLFGADAGGIWSETSPVPSTGGAFNPIAGTFTTDNQPAGTYTFNYTVFATAPCANDFETVTVIIHPQPIADAGLDGALDCTNTAFELGPDIVNPAFTYIWTGPIVSQLSNPVVSLPGTYILTVSTVAGCSDMDTVVLTNNINYPTAVINPTFTTLTCVVSSSTLDGSQSTPDGGVNYIWSLNSSIISTDSSFAVQAGGIYVLTVVNPLNTCVDTAVVTILVDQGHPFVSIATADQITCITSEVQLDATASATGPEYDYVWSATNGGNIVSGNTTLEPLCDATGTYTLVITDNSNGCIDSADVQITANLAPPLAVATATGTLDCVKEVVTLSGVGSSIGIGITYSWSTSDGHIAGASNGLNVQADAPGTYDLTVYNANNGCSATTSVFLAENIDAPSLITTTVIEPNCYGECNASFYVNNVTGGTGPYIYSLDGLFYTSVDSFSLLCAGVYNLTVQDSFGCTGQQEVIIDQPAEIAIELGRDTIILLGSDYTLTAIPNIPDSEIDTIIWSSYVDTSCLQVDLCFMQTFTPVETGLYSITMTDVNGCTATDDIIINVDKPQRVFVPNIFSPNGDGINDLFYVQAGPDVLRVKSFRVFDRWGEKLFDREDILPNDPYNGWDGRLRGVDMNPQVFVFWVEVEFIDGTTEFYKGDLTLLR